MEAAPASASCGIQLLPGGVLVGVASVAEAGSAGDDGAEVQVVAAVITAKAIETCAQTRCALPDQKFVHSRVDRVCKHCLQMLLTLRAHRCSDAASAEIQALLQQLKD